MANADGFVLHPRLAADTLPLRELALCSLRLMNDANYPWLLLVPRVSDARELHHLTQPDQATLWRETMLASRALEVTCTPHKLNVGALGNLVPQLHVHIVARFENDPAWPGPVWGAVPPSPYDPAAAAALVAVLTATLDAVSD